MTTSTTLVTGVDFIAVPTQDYDEGRARSTATCSASSAPSSGATCPRASSRPAASRSPIMQSDAFGQEFHRHGAPIALHVDDVAAARAELEAKGVEFVAGHDRQRRLPHGDLRRPRRQPADVPQPLRAEGRAARRLGREQRQHLLVVRLRRGLRDHVRDRAVGVDDERRALHAPCRCGRTSTSRPRCRSCSQTAWSASASSVKFSPCLSWNFLTAFTGSGETPSTAAPAAS